MYKYNSKKFKTMNWKIQISYNSEYGVNDNLEISLFKALSKFPQKYCANARKPCWKVLTYIYFESSNVQFLFSMF